jgi:hypothetical protein
MLQGGQGFQLLQDNQLLWPPTRASCMCPSELSVMLPLVLLQVMLAKPSVRYRKTVNAYDRNGHRTAVNAQQYAVLVTNVNAPCYPEFMVKR